MGDFIVEIAIAIGKKIHRLFSFDYARIVIVVLCVLFFLTGRFVEGLYYNKNSDHPSLLQKMSDSVAPGDPKAPEKLGSFVYYRNFPYTTAAECAQFGKESFDAVGLETLGQKTDAVWGEADDIAIKLYCHVYDTISVATYAVSFARWREAGARSLADRLAESLRLKAVWALKKYEAGFSLDDVKNFNARTWYTHIGMRDGDVETCRDSFTTEATKLKFKVDDSNVYMGAYSPAKLIVARCIANGENSLVTIAGFGGPGDDARPTLIKPDAQAIFEKMQLKPLP